MTIVNTVYILVVVAAGVVAMTHETVQTRYGIKDLASRLVLGAVAANFSFALLGLLLRLADALIRAMAGAPLGEADTRAVVQSHVSSALISPTNAMLSLVLALMAVVLLIVLAAQWYVRLGVLVLLAMVAPLALACYALPGLDQAAGIWWRTLAAALGTQALQALMIVGGLRVFLDPEAQLVMVLPTGVAGQLATAGSPVNLLIMIVVLYTTFKVPAMMRRWVLRGGGGGGARVAVVLAAQQITRGLSRGLGGGRVVRVRP